MADDIQIPKMDGKSLDIEASDKEKLKTVFPQCFNEGKLDIDKLLSLCGEYIDNDFEKYKFEWKGKSECYRIAGKRSTGTLRPVPEESVNFDKTNNLYIEGDNLEVLKLLQTAYYREVKMIYIDPPYNTGNDFVYEDNFKDPLAKYKEITSQTTKSNPETMGRYHTNWLNMMYPRLRLAANLLRDDGVIFISIDDNEVTNLRRLCDEVFGEENMLAMGQWRRVEGKPGKSKYIGRTSEFVLIYSKNKDNFVVGTLPLSEEGLKEFRYFDERGKFRRGQIFYPNRGSYNYEVISPYGNKICGDFTISKGKFEEYNKNSYIYWAEQGDHTPYLKIYLEDFEGVTPTNTFGKEFGSSQGAVKEFKEIFGMEQMIFDNPKPTKLIKRLLRISNAKNSDIILDFFSGSATTAHAVMQLNAEDGGNRQFIMVQLPEITNEKSEAFKAGYKNICEIGKERIRRAGRKIMEEYSKTPSPLRGEGWDEGDKLNLLPFAREMRYNPTDAEQKLWYALHNNQLGYKFRRQHQIGNYIVDFVCLNKKLIIECDGGQHNENIDKNRTDFLNKEGYKVLRFWNNEILSNIDGVLYKIKDVLDNTPHPNPLPQGARELASAIPQKAKELDIGFKVFKLDTSNLVKWDGTPTNDTNVLKERFDSVVKTLKFDRSELDIVYEVMLKLGIPLTYKVNLTDINGRKVYSIGDDGLILVCLDGLNGGITPEDVSAMCELAPAKIIAAEEAFKDDVALSNAFYISKDKGIEIELL